MVDEATITYMPGSSPATPMVSELLYFSVSTRCGMMIPLKDQRRVKPTRSGEHTISYNESCGGSLKRLSPMDVDNDEISLPKAGTRGESRLRKTSTSKGLGGQEQNRRGTCQSTADIGSFIDERHFTDLEKNDLANGRNGTESEHLSYGYGG